MDFIYYLLYIYLLLSFYLKWSVCQRLVTVMSYITYMIFMVELKANLHSTRVNVQIKSV